MYAQATRARDLVGRWAFITLVGFLIVAYLGNLLGAPPPSVTAIYILGLIGGAVLLVWAWWVDKHRQAAEIKPQGT